MGSDDSKEAVIWIVDDLKGAGRLRPLTFGSRNLYPIWTPDGRFLVFQSDRGGDRALWWQRADGSTQADRLTKPEAGAAHAPNSWTPDGRTLAFEVSAPVKPSSIWTLSLDSNQKPTLPTLVPE